MRRACVLVAVAAGSTSTEAFAPAATGFALRGSAHAGFAGAQSIVHAGPVRRADGVLGLSANLKNTAKVNQIVPRTWKEGIDYSTATKVCAICRDLVNVPPACCCFSASGIGGLHFLRVRFRCILSACVANAFIKGLCHACSKCRNFHSRPAWLQKQKRVACDLVKPFCYTGSALQNCEGIASCH